MRTVPLSFGFRSQAGRDRRYDRAMPRSLLAVLASFLAACGISSTRDAPDDAGIDAATGTRRDTGSDAFTAPDAFVSDGGTDSGRMCIQPCTLNSECAASCPVRPGTVRCCDVLTGLCFVAAPPECPAYFRDAGADADRDAACFARPPLSHVTVTAPSLPGATFRIDTSVGTSTETTLDATGTGALDTDALGIAFDATHVGRLSDMSFGYPFVVQVSTSSVHLQLTVHTAFAMEAPLGVSEIDLVVRRDITTGECVASALSVSQDCVRQAGLDDPSQLDDAPCGPFR